nr:MAG TPA: hypothetical protein [Caudoviricetes sp.]
MTYKLCRHEKVSVHADFRVKTYRTYSNSYPDPEQKKIRVYTCENALNARPRRVYRNFRMLSYR